MRPMPPALRPHHALTARRICSGAALGVALCCLLPFASRGQDALGLNGTSIFYQTPVWSLSDDESVPGHLPLFADASDSMPPVPSVLNAPPAAEGGPFGLATWLDQRPVGDPQLDIVRQQTRPAGRGPEPARKWYERLSLRGYAQFRINEVLELQPGSAPPHHAGDRSVGENQSFIIRRARVILSGDVSNYMFIYLQPDFASSVPGSPDATYFTQIRDWYADCYFDADHVYRVRVGQSKVPYGWENMQSSSNRIPLDRNDALNSAVRNERDLGVFFYWTPEEAQDFFKSVLDQGLKGSGNYGVLGLGFYNGQGGSFIEQNDDLHFVARLTVPMELASGQYVEAGIQGYTGQYVVLSSPISPLGVGAPARPSGTLETGNRGILDKRLAGTFVWYPQPFGFQSEWTVGRGPALNDEQTEVTDRPLYGGYVMGMYRYETDCYGVFFPFVRYNQFKGGYKPERNAPFSHIEEWELGLEWQLNPQMELTGVYAFTDRTNTTAFGQAGARSYEQFAGQLLRLQFQVNY